MSAIASIPVNVTAEAAAQVAKLGLQAQLQQMIEHTRQSVPGLRCIDVELAPRYDEPKEEPGVTILATRDDPHLDDDPTGRELAHWIVSTFPPDVFRHLLIQIHYESADAR
jgi:hypothetical protein